MKKGVIVAMLLFFLLVMGTAFSGNHDNNKNNEKVDSEVEDLLEQVDEVSVIVVLEDDYDVLNEYSVSSLNEMDEFEKKKAMVEEQQENVLSDLDLKQEKTLGILEDTDFDFELKRKYSTVNAFSGNVTEDGLEKLKNDPEIKEVYLNGIKYINLDVSVPLINATKTWSLVHNSTNITGKHETVCVIDTGVNYTHPNLGGCTNESFLAGNCSKVIAGYDYANDDDDPMDDHSHGTHVAGTVASNDSTYKGVAPDAKIVALKVCNSGGSCSDADINAGIDWCTNNASKYNISVITISLGDKTTHNTYCNENNHAPYINTAVGQDILVTVSAGNCDWLGASCIAGPSSPACIENATAIGAVNDADSITYQRGALFELLAPGVGIISTYFNGGFASSSGTSMAAPHAAGAAVLMQQFFKLQNGTSLTPSEIRSALNSTGKLIDDTGNSGYSFSRINIFAAIGALDTIAPNITIKNPENNTIKTNLTFIVNISSNEVLANATLEINNTNFTMAGSGLEWNVNVSSLKNGSYTYKIYGNDSFGNLKITDAFTVNIDLIPPYWSNNITNISDINNVKKNNVFQFNITWNDTVDLSSFIFSWNDTGNWENITNGSLNGKTQIVSINKTITATRGNVIGYKFYANDSANNLNETVTWIFSIANTPPETPSIVFPSSNLYTSQQPLDINVTAFDADNDTLNISYYINGLLNQTSLTNTTFNASEGHFILNVSAYDGAAVSSNASINFTIDTTRPTANTTLNISLTSIKNNDIVNITANVTDNFDLSAGQVIVNISGFKRFFNFTLSGKSAELSQNITINVTKGEVINFTVRVNDTANNFHTNDTIITVANSNPEAVNLTINSTDFLNRTNGTLTGAFSFTDADNDAITDNETKWYNNSVEYNLTLNLTSISAQNTTKGENWTFSVRVYDGTSWGNWANSTKLTIRNTIPAINITINNITVNETQKVNITTNASDLDNDALTFTANDSRFSLEGIHLIWNTNLTDNGAYSVNVTVNDTEDIDSKIVTVTVLDVRDLDNDGNPDFNDTDDDNDGISDTNDFLSGNLSSINTTLTIINITVNGTTNLSKLYNGTFFINITNGTHPIVEFNFTFNENNTLDLGGITFNRTTNGSSAISIRGINLTGINKTKTVFLEKVNTTVDAVCIKDVDTDFSSISSACDASNEVLVDCDNATSGGYACFDTGTRYKITGLNHSAVKELCVDKDGDGYGNGCAAGSDSCDSNPSEYTESGCNPPAASSSGSGGGGGGGGGGTLTATSAGTEKIHFYQSLISGQEIKINVNRDAIAFEKTEFTVNKDLEGITITIRLLEEDDAPNTIENAYQYVEVETDGITDNDISNVKIDFKVNNSWFTDNNFDSDTVVLNRYDDDWKKLSTIKISKTSYEATSPGFSLFAITADKLKQKKIESKITKKAVNETKKTEAKDTDITGIAVAESKKTIFPVGIAITIVVIISGILTYISILGIGKNRKT